MRKSHHDVAQCAMTLIAPAGTIMPLQKTYLRRAILTSVLPFRWMQRRFFRWCCADLAHQAPDVIEALVDEAMLCKRCFVPPHYKQLPTLTAMTDHEFQHLTIPIAVFVGENEVLYSAQAAIQRLKQVAPQIHAEIIPHAGHDLLLSQKAIVNQKLPFSAQRLIVPCRKPQHASDSKTGLSLGTIGR